MGFASDVFHMPSLSLSLSLSRCYFKTSLLDLFAAVIDPLLYSCSSTSSFQG